MTEKERGLVLAYQSYQRSRGERGFRKTPYWLAVFFGWLIEKGLELGEVGSREAEDYQTYLATKEKDGMVHYASRTVRSIVGVANQFYLWQIDRGMAVNNPFHGMKRIKGENALPRNVPTVEDLAARLEGLRQFWASGDLKEECGHYKVHVIAEFMYSTGMRINEALQVKPEDIDWSRGMVKIRDGKGGVERTAYLNEYAREVLRIYVEEMRPVVNRSKTNVQLFGITGDYSAPDKLNLWFKKTVGMTSHGFRHSVGTHLLQAGCDLRFIQMILGHEDLKSTALYTKISKENLRNQLDEYHPRR